MCGDQARCSAPCITHTAEQTHACLLTGSSSRCAARQPIVRWLLNHRLSLSIPPGAVQATQIDHREHLYTLLPTYGHRRELPLAPAEATLAATAEQQHLSPMTAGRKLQLRLAQLRCTLKEAFINSSGLTVLRCVGKTMPVAQTYACVWYRL
jgi:hypothetical protein